MKYRKNPIYNNFSVGLFKDWIIFTAKTLQTPFSSIFFDLHAFRKKTKRVRTHMKTRTRKSNIIKNYLAALIPSLCTPSTALPEGSFTLRNEASHAKASAVLHATDGTDGTHWAAVWDGKCSSKMQR